MSAFNRSTFSAAVALALCMNHASAQQFSWETGVNNGTIAPGGDPAATFRSYNQPAIDNAGLIVFRARSSAGSGAQISGVYQRDLSGPNPVVKLVARDDVVPDPNNTSYNGVPSSFTEFPSTPRIDQDTGLVATRGQHKPVWTYLLGATETRVGTSGIYAFPQGVGVTGASLLGSALEADQVTLSFPWYSVPGAILGTRFDQFPGSPAVTNGRYIVFKGNYTDPLDGLGRTGVYFRDVLGGTPTPYTGLIADSNTLVPNQPKGGSVKFGSTAPPSAANGLVYFTGLDIEEAPTLGGIYRAQIPASPPPLAPLALPLSVMVGIGDPVPGEPPGAVFNGLGEGLSVSSDGNLVAFWARWGTETFEKTLLCPTDGNADLIAFCNETYPDGLVVNIPVHQGIFIHDATSGITSAVARTQNDGVEDLLFWVFSGRPPGVGGTEDTDIEPARWRSSGFAALSFEVDQPTQVVFKAQRNGLVGLYLRESSVLELPLRTVAEVGTTPGTELDPLAPAGSLISSVGVEREGFRNGRLAITATMLYVDPIDPTITESWGGIYMSTGVIDLIFRDGFD
ncbi:hypothetical protein [Dokdonella immobilis]|uniref:Uncharacterized protein n=1 Tax=Dokdonella immobilis TaxID=578942 RepID=A0A1I5A9T5_9GAMM|nr:hypothetical protein [Dokdonella immobilis]SFN59235.1 hypothetical protein SAMN05216289_13416 [Dokdonella immobilis]